MFNHNEDVDDIDLTIMQMCDDASSVREMGAAVNRSVASVQNRLQNLCELGLVQPPAVKQMHRSYRTTDFGRGFLQANSFTR